MDLGLRRQLLDKLRGTPSRRMLVKRGLKLGREVFLGEGVYIDPGHCWLIEIGDASVISLKTVILAHDASSFGQLGFSRVARVCIGKGVFIGCGAVILPGVRIGDGAVVGAGAVVTADVPPRALVAGNPARLVRTVDEFIGKRAQAMQTRPCWPLEHWTLAGGITEADKRIQWEALGDGDGYVR
jgi:maltose O-acetyltransferase